MNNRRLLIICIISIFFLLVDIVDLSAKDRTYGGKVIDADTKEPIEGAVVVAVWMKERAVPPTGSDTELKDVKETLTDRDGTWSIGGPEGETDKLIPGLLKFFMIYITREPYFVVFKPGYCSWPQGYSVDACKEKLKPRGIDKIIKGENVELPKLTNRDRMTIIRNMPSLGWGGEAEKNLTLFKKLIEHEKKGFGGKVK